MEASLAERARMMEIRQLLKLALADAAERGGASAVFGLVNDLIYGARLEAVDALIKRTSSLVENTR